MKYFEMMLATGNNTADALQNLKAELLKEYEGKSAQLKQIFILPEAQATGVTNPNGQPQIKVVVNLVAIVEEEPELDNLQRNFKPLFDYLNTNSKTFGTMALGWLQSVADLVPAEAVTKQTPFNE